MWAFVSQVVPRSLRGLLQIFRASVLLAVQKEVEAARTSMFSPVALLGQNQNDNNEGDGEDDDNIGDEDPLHAAEITDGVAAENSQGILQQAQMLPPIPLM